MTREDLQAQVASLSQSEKTELLGRLMTNVTVAARLVYPPAVEPTLAVRKLMAFNEVQHRIASQLRSFLGGRAPAFPDDAFVDVLFEHAVVADCQADLIVAFEHSFD
jgi:hypothetical protein